MVGKTLAHYKLTEQICSGGMGVIYRAEDIHLGRTVAIKFLPPNLATGMFEKKRFITEAKALASLNHPNVATIYGIEEYNNESFIVMEYIDGYDLRKFLNKYQPASDEHFLPVEKILQLVIQAVEGLQAAHQKQIIHRDIKPENIMILEDARVKILDFGLAKMEGREQLTRTGITMGTAAYMSPEQSRGDPIDYRTDIWAVGVILYEMITGKRPFRGAYEQAVIYSILNEIPEPLDRYRNDIPDKLKKIVYRALAKDPADRYQSCQELLEELRNCSETVKQSSTRNNNKFVPLSRPNVISSSFSKVRPLWKISAVILLLSLILIYVLAHKSRSEIIQNKKIAVLPFLNMSNDPNDEYFSDGIMEDILTQLVKISGLKVISRTTMMRYKNTDKNLTQISKELKADVVLEGSVRHYADKLRISVQLIDANTDEHLWAETYDRSLKNIFEIQSQIASQVAGTLETELSSSEEKELNKLTATTPEAYNAYLQGRYFLNRRTNEDVNRAIVYFKQVLHLDSTYAPAWVGLSKAHSYLGDMGIIPLEESYNASRTEAEKALKLDPNLADAYARRAWIRMTYDRDWSGADADYKKALQLEPGNAAIIQSAGVLASVLGRLDEAVELTERAIELNPLLSTPNYNLGLHFYYMHKWQKARTSVLRALELNPQYPAAHILLGRIYLAQSKTEEALSEIQKETEPAWRKFGLSLVYYAMGKKKEANTSLAELIKEYQNESAYQVAEVYSFRNESDNAFKWLERAYQQRDGGLSDMNGDPLLDNLEKDPRYFALREKMNF